MTALPLTRRKFTSEEYLVIERAASTRSEFFDGDIYDMAGASESHTIICDNISGEIRTRLKGTSCLGMSQNVKVPAGGMRLFAYPDYLIVCGERRYSDSRLDILTNPLVLWEVLSPSTELYDRTTKFELYKQIESLREYVLVAQDRPVIEHWVRMDDGSWRQNVLMGRAAVLTLEAVPVAVPFAELYDRIEFSATPSR